MTPFFNTPDRLKQLDDEARTWLNTPFAPHQCVKAAGVDCVHLPGAVLVACGHLPAAPKFPEYTIDGGQHNTDSAVTTWLRSSTYFWWSPILVPQPGDILCFRQRKTAHHVGILLPPSSSNFNLPFIHALERYGVSINSLDDPAHRRILVAIFRPVTPAAA